MAYDSEKLLADAKKNIEKNKLVFVDEVISMLPCTVSTFYKHFPYDSEEMKEVKKLLQQNKIALKTRLRKKMYDSNNTGSWIALYKLIGTEDEAHRLNGSSQRIDHTTKGKAIGTNFGWDESNDDVDEEQ